MIIEACIIGICVVVGLGLVAGAITNLTNQVTDMYCELVDRAIAADNTSPQVKS